MPVPQLPTLSQNLEQSLSRALALANESRHEGATLEHLLLALIDDPDAAAVMRACNVESGRLQHSLTAYVETELERFPTDGSVDSRPDQAFQHTIQRAVTHVQTCGREQVTGADALVAILDDHKGRAAELMQEQGTTRYDATRFLSHGIAKSDETSHGRCSADDPGQHTMPEQPSGSLAKVLLLNDNYTPMEFVVGVLERLFDRDHEAATRIMLEIHHHGSGICGIYPSDEAAAKVAEVLEIAREQQHPLQCVLERSTSI
jgi:ATP-dependent Clp protease ATP-binding subunit ClpA